MTQATVALTHAEARLIASLWHGGQFTGLYALSSSGSPYLYKNRCHHCGVHSTAAEVRRCLLVADPSDQQPLLNLEAWLEEEADDHACGCDPTDEGGRP